MSKTSALQAIEVQPDLVEPKVDHWSLPFSRILNNPELRLDASHYDPVASNALSRTLELGYELKPLRTFATLRLPNQFTRIWAKDETYGQQYVNATDIMSYLAMGCPAGPARFLSGSTETNIDNLVIRAGWLLLTCSGTIGRVFNVPEQLDGFVATHDLIRVIPIEPDMTGYLYAWLTSEHAQAQIAAYTHGGQIDHVTDVQIAEIMVPDLPLASKKKISKKIVAAHRTREAAMRILTNGWVIDE